MHFEILNTEHLHLRKLSPEVFDFIYKAYSDAALVDFLGLESAEALEKEKQKYRKGLSTFNKSFVYFQIIHKKNEKVIGWCGFHTWYLDHARAEIGYGLFDENFRGKGIMSEALEPVVRYGFQKMELNRIEAFISPANTASVRLAQKFGFVQEGLLSEHYCKDSVLEDSAVFSLLRRNYRL